MAFIKLIVTQEYNLQSNNLRYYEFNITQNIINPDCSNHSSPVLLVNNQLPGPTIKANQGDRIKILVRNQLVPMPTPNDHRHDVSIHFHGIRQYGTNQADGVPYLTQYPIPPGEEYIYEFRVVNQAGTYFYHAHVGLQEQTVFGPIIIQESTENLGYHDERTILLSEWWHRPSLEFEDFLMGPNFTFIPEAHSVLINGRTLHDSNRISVSQCEGYESIQVQPNKIYRLRVIGATTFRTLGFAIAHHNLTVIEVDGEPTKPYTVNQLEVAPGQRFSVLLHTDQDVNEYSIQVVRRWSDNVPRPTNGLAILKYEETVKEPRGILRLKKKQKVMLKAPTNRAQFEEAYQEKVHWEWANIQPLYGVDPIVYKPATKTIKLRSTEELLKDGTRRWFVNGVSFMETEMQPILFDIKKNLRQSSSNMTVDGYDTSLGTYPINYFDIVDLVFQNTHIPGEPCRSHPWHTHGHSHWQIAYGSGEYVDERDKDIRNIEHPLQKDITMVYPAEDPSLFYVNNTPVKTAVGCGWSKVRILADNPGIWAVHCHNTPHMLMGMMVALEEAPELIPKYIDTKNS